MRFTSLKTFKHLLELMKKVKKDDDIDWVLVINELFDTTAKTIEVLTRDGTSSFVPKITISKTDENSNDNV